MDNKKKIENGILELKDEELDAVVGGRGEERICATKGCNNRTSNGIPYCRACLDKMRKTEDDRR